MKKKHSIWIYILVEAIMVASYIVLYFVSKGTTGEINDGLNIMGGSLVIIAGAFHEAWFAFKPEGMFSGKLIKIKYHEKGKPEKYLEGCVVIMLVGLLLMAFGFSNILLSFIM